MDKQASSSTSLRSPTPESSHQAKHPAQQVDSISPSKPGFKQLLQSMLAGAVGVQSSKRYQQDFGSSSIMPYVIGGIICSALFIGSILLLVNYLLSAHQ